MGQLTVIFDQIILSSTMASVLVMILLLVKRIFKKKLSPAWHYYLWFLLLFRLLIPYAPESPASIYNIITPITGSMTGNTSNQSTSAVQEFIGARSQAGQGTGIFSNPIIKYEEARKDNSKGKARKSINDVFHLPNIKTYFIIVWLTGLVLFAIYILVLNLKLFRKIRFAPPTDDESVNRILNECRSIIGVASTLPVIFTTAVCSPSLCGLFHPRLLLPYGLNGRIDNDAMKYIFLHEFAHLKRRDNIMNWVAVVIKVLHWFNPLVWYGFYRMRQDCEVACDALVLSRLKPEERKAYGYMIIHLLRMTSKPQWMPGATAMLAGKSQMKRRIIMISLFKKDSARWTVLAIILFMAIGFIGLTNARLEDKNVYTVNQGEESKTGKPVEDKGQDKGDKYSQIDGKQMEEKLTAIVNPLDKSLMVSSNPYTYIKAANTEYNDIVAMGRPALEYLLKRFENSKEDGLESWVMASICCEILGEGNPVKSWSSGRMWYESYIKAPSGKSIPAYPEIQGEGVIVTLSDNKDKGNPFLVHDTER